MNTYYLDELVFLFLFFGIPLLFLTVISLLVNVKNRIKAIEDKLKEVLDKE
ncbi:hypothetical protein [Halobacillus sp. Nhm2S1]|uniref:hypothetical protein n=1 Tax=Halobacillus sp. Nhm2S1 TaxID=2866716 RepID=UPI001C72DC84|nr:hypothetical protein [Halobacillus sp. Nhm2S1]MBX0356860.1 hypothetical protein [Halobacillus sp. Nhm2S1]